MIQILGVESGEGKKKFSRNSRSPGKCRPLSSQKSPHTGALGLVPSIPFLYFWSLGAPTPWSLCFAITLPISSACLITLYFNSIILIYPKIFMPFNKMVTAHRVWKEGVHTKRLSWGGVGSVVFKCAPSITILYLYLYFLSIIVSTSG